MNTTTKQTTTGSGPVTMIDKSASYTKARRDLRAAGVMLVKSRQWEEYRVRMVDAPAITTYHTSDLVDAIETAVALLRDNGVAVVLLNSEKTTGYDFERYDVLQCERNGKWVDFSTLRTLEEAEQATTLVDRGVWDGAALPFRIVGNTAKREIKYVRRSTLVPSIPTLDTTSPASRLRALLNDESTHRWEPTAADELREVMSILSLGSMGWTDEKCAIRRRVERALSKIESK